MALINKETIRAEINRRIRNETTNASYLELGRIQGNNTLAEHLLSFLDNLEAEENNAFCKENCKGYQDTGRCFCDGGCEAKKKSKEKDVDLAEHYKQWVKEYKEQHDGEFPDAWTIVNHFYELGCRHTAVMYDDIEYKGQRAEEAELSGEKMFKELGTTKEEYLAKSMDKVHLEMEIATYLQDWEDDDEMGLHLSTDEGCMPIELEDVRDLARHFAEWGAAHGKK